MSGKKRPGGVPWQPLREAVNIRRPLPPHIAALIRNDDDAHVGTWINDRYVVQVFRREHDITELSIRRTDREWPRDWRHFQRIKNEICGPEREAVELYPAESRLVDGANQFHLWVLPPGARFDFGYWPTGRSVIGSDHPALQGVTGGKQRDPEEMS